MKEHSMKRAMLVVVGALTLGMGCGTRCTLKLVRGELMFLLPEARASELTMGASRIEACIDSTCWSDDLDAAGQGSRTTFDASSRRLSVVRERLTGGPNGESQGVPARADSDVTLTLSRDGGVVFTRRWTDAVFEQTEPNGEGCGEIYLLKEPLTF